MGEKAQGQKSKVIREFSAGGVVYKRTSDNLLFLIINPKDSPRWQFPKGHIDPGESSEQAAVREVKEEGGVTAKPIQKIGETKIFFTLKGERIFKTIIYYLMEYQGKSEKAFNKKEIKKAEFLSFEEAQERLTFKNDKETLQKAKDLING